MPLSNGNGCCVAVWVLCRDILYFLSLISLTLATDVVLLIYEKCVVSILDSTFFCATLSVHTTLSSVLSCFDSDLCQFSSQAFWL